MKKLFYLILCLSILCVGCSSDDEPTDPTDPNTETPGTETPGGNENPDPEEPDEPDGPEEPKDPEPEPDSDYIVINGIRWDTENVYWQDTEDMEGVHNKDGNSWITFEAALRIAEKLGKRLPTKEEIDELLEFGFTFDEDLYGCWLGPDHSSKSNITQSIFLPMLNVWYKASSTGNMVYYDTLKGGFYWLDYYSDGKVYDLSLSAFNAFSSSRNNTTQYLSLRLVTDDIQEEE